MNSYNIYYSCHHFLKSSTHPRPSGVSWSINNLFNGTILGWKSTIFIYLITVHIDILCKHGFLHYISHFRRQGAVSHHFGIYIGFQNKNMNVKNHTVKHDLKGIHNCSMALWEGRVSRHMHRLCSYARRVIFKVIKTAM